MLLNPFAQIDAQNAMHRLAHVASNEAIVTMTPPVRNVSIVPDDIGDEDCRKVVYDVWEGDALLRTFQHVEDARQWCSDCQFNVLFP